MKSDKRLDEEIKAVAKFWNNSEIEVPSRECTVASAIYHTLRWARGYREKPPLITLIAVLVDDKEGRWEPSSKVRAEKAMRRIREEAKSRLATR